MNNQSSSQRIIVVGAGIAGLATALRLAESGLPVTVFEAAQIGANASTRNQGWLHSGAWFARGDLEFARACHASFLETRRLCPECVEPQQRGMLYLFTHCDGSEAEWRAAWRDAGIPFESIELTTVRGWIPDLRRDAVSRAYLLPDVSVRSHVLLERLAAAARNAGAEIRLHTPVWSLLRDNNHVEGIVTSFGERVHAQFVILATGSQGVALQSELNVQVTGDPETYCCCAVKSHLVALKPMITPVAFCIVDQNGFNHMPHPPASVFGSNRWLPVSRGNDMEADPEEIDVIWKTIDDLFPRLKQITWEAEWAGTTMRVEDRTALGRNDLPWPTIVDHRTQTNPVENVLSVYPGRASLWSTLAEQTRKLVLQRLQRLPMYAHSPPWSRNNRQMERSQT